MKPPSHSFSRLVWVWWSVLRDPSRIKGGEFPLRFMLAVWFYLGFLYHTFHYFLYPELVEEFHAGLDFWLHSLFGGVGGVSSFLVVGVAGYAGLKLLGKRVKYSRWEVQLFSTGFWVVFFLLFFSLLCFFLGFTGPTGKVEVLIFHPPLLPRFPMALPVAFTLPLGILLFLRIFKSLGLRWKELPLVALAILFFHFFLKELVYLTLKAWGSSDFGSQCGVGILLGLGEGGIAWFLREKILGKI